MLLAIALALAARSPETDATKLTLSQPTAIVEVDTRKLRGDLYRLAWSPDGEQMYLQTVARDGAGHIKETHHYALALNGHAPTQLPQEPDWAAAYWAWKSGRSAPGLPAVKIEVEEQQQRVSSTATPMGGDLARGSPEAGGLGNPGEVAAAQQSQMVHSYTLRLKGEVIGQFVNAPAIPGLTFGWGPEGTGLIAFSNQAGRMVVMDGQGRKQPIASSKATLIPAWTADGTRLAYFERTGKNKAALKIVGVKPQTP